MPETHAGSDPSEEFILPERIHVVGVGGAGMSAIASVLLAMGHHVSGSDLKASAVTERLASSGIDITIGHRPEAVAGAGLVTTSTAVRPENPEVAEAHRLGIPVWSRARMLAAIAAQRRVIAVGGTHGKTTTTSMLSLILVEGGLRPSFLIGGDVNEIGTNAVWDEGEWLVVEADESDGTFLTLGAEIAVVTNVEADHLDYYRTYDALADAFRVFMSEATGSAVVCGSDDEAARLGRAAGATLVGGTGPALGQWELSEVELKRSSVAFTLTDPTGVVRPRLSVPVPGLHNVQNASVAAVAAERAEVPWSSIVTALARFAGVARRFEFRGSANGVTFVDDYAHLPTEVRAVLGAARHGGWGRVVAVFQPHRYSRTSELWQEFGAAFTDADVVVVTDIYGAGEAPVPGISGKLVADAIRTNSPDIPVHYVALRGSVAGEVAALLAPGDLCCTLGAGDLTSLPDEIMGLVAR